MSFTGKSDNYGEHFLKNSSESEESYQTDEEISDESCSEFVTELENISIEDKPKNSWTKTRGILKNQYGRLNVSLRNRKNIRYFRVKNQSRKAKKRKRFITKSQNFLEKPTETPKKGKRCRLGGKAKGKPPDEENHEKHDSDDESDHSYFGRVSLGYFQKFVDHSGASTSYQWEEDSKNSILMSCIEPLHGETSEEMELLELQKWGMTGLVSSPKKNSERFGKSKDIQPDIL